MSKAYDFKYFAYIYILNHPSNVVAQLSVAQLVCRPGDHTPSSRGVTKQSLKISPQLKCVLHYLVKGKCQETTNNLKQISCLTINSNFVS